MHYEETNMASIESRLYYFLLRLINKKKFLQLQFAFGRFDFYNSKEPPPETYYQCNIVRRTFHSRNVFTLTPKNAPSGKHILYIHGGAYVQNFVRQHWKFLAMIVEHTQCTITAPDYPLAPQYTYVDSFAMMIPLYREITESSGTSDTILMGDSAGGGFALALAQKASEDGLQQPAKIILLSPWLDITLENPMIGDIDPLDPFLGLAGLKKAGAAYAGKANPRDFMLSPIYGPLHKLAPITIFIGSKDVLVADARKLCNLAKQQGIIINYHEYADMVHVWMFLNFRESKKAQREILALIMQ